MEVATAENTKIDLTEFLDDKGELIISDWTEEMTEKYGLDFQIKKLPMKVIHGIRIECTHRRSYQLSKTWIPCIPDRCGGRIGQDWNETL